MNFKHFIKTYTVAVFIPALFLIAASCSNSRQNNDIDYLYTGKSVEEDSIYIFDNAPDSENEGFVRFRDYKTDKAGIFNKNREIAVPAEYSDLTIVRNGMIIALKGAEREYHENGDFYKWKGGQELLIDTLNNILIEDFPLTYNLNFYSVEISQTPHSDSTRKSFLAKDGTYYSFEYYKTD